LGKIKVAELAKKVNMTEDAVIKKLKAIAIDVKSGEDLVDEALAQRFSTNAGPHIIRRKVKVVTTDEQGNKVEKITTNAGGTIHQSVVREKKQEKPAYSKEGLGVVKSNRSRNNRNVMQNIVVTQNGKKIEPKPEPKAEKPVERSYDRPEVSVADAKRIVNSFAEQREQRINERREQNFKPANNTKTNSKELIMEIIILDPIEMGRIETLIEIQNLEIDQQVDRILKTGIKMQVKVRDIK